MSEQKPSHEVEGIFRRAPRQDCVEAKIWARVPKNLNNIEVPPKNTVTSIILKWKKFGTTKTLPTAGRLFLQLAAQTEQLGEKGLGQGDSHPDRAPEFLCGDGRTFQNDNHLCSTPPIRPLS
jgi:hypothetical protein